MCGIAGSWTFSGRWSAQEQRHSIVTMTRQLARRGPDDEGFWFDPEQGLAFGHRRLAILGLGPSGRQPFHSAEPPGVLVVNGELFNYQELRRELAMQRHVCRGDSDSEVMLKALLAWGVNKSVERFDGMFAFAFWDIGSHTLHLARDRMGEKPLFYGFLD